MTTPETAPLRLYLVRHGRTALNAAGCLRGRLDPPLDGIGVRQVEELAAAFAVLPERPQRIVAGPLLRTRQTADAIARACGLGVLVDDRLVDRDYGPWTGALEEEVRATHGADLVDLPGAESVADLVSRAGAVLDAQLPHLQHPVVLVSHDAVCSHLLTSVCPGLGRPHTVRQDPACWNRLERQGDRWYVAAVNQHADALRNGT